MTMKVCVLVVGGVAEMRESHPERIRVVLKNRKGFAKIALTTGADLGKIIESFVAVTAYPPWCAIT